MGSDAESCPSALFGARRAHVAVSRCLEGLHGQGGDKILGRKGRFWQEGYWDTYMRDREHEVRTQRYIENNPTKAKLVVLPKEWPWSSARFRDDYQRLCLPAG